MRYGALIAGFWIFSLLALADGENPSSESIRFEISVPLESDLGKEASAAFTSIFQSLGFNLTVIYFPVHRGILELQRSRVDGTVGRIGNLTKIFNIKGIVRIDYPIVFSTATLWCRKNAGQAKPKIRLGYRSGNALISLLVQSITNKNIRTEDLTSYNSFVSMLQSGRLDCVIANPISLEASGVKLADLQEFVRKDLISSHAYAWISKRYEYLKPEIEKKLKSYPFSTKFRTKFQTGTPVCQNQFDLLCPDGLIFQQKIDFRNY